VKQAATLQRPDEGAEIGEGRSVAVCQTERRFCGITPWRRGIAGWPLGVIRARLAC
jgi:hypothetical protein